jgi:hypothetical protein
MVIDLGNESVMCRVTQSALHLTKLEFLSHQCSPQSDLPYCRSQFECSYSN